MKKLHVVAVMAVMLCLAGLTMSGEAQAQRFADNGNGTVTDTVTGLMWTKDANPFGKLNWHDAMSMCSAFSISGIGGWRLPSKDELVTLYHAIQGGHPFPGVQSSYYWSSTIYKDHKWNPYPMIVLMHSGNVTYDGKAQTYHVWPVRSGQ